jgi:4-hydroxy-4-methyl-2-oxoglutarate aldolase
VNLPDLTARLLKLPAAVISDVLGEMGLRHQVLSSAIKPIDPASRIAGPAFCIRGEEGPEKPARAGSPKVGFEMDRHLYHGCVAVIDSGGCRTNATMGGNVAMSFRLRGCGGVVTDGAIRDAAEFGEVGLPAFCTFTTPLAPKGRWHYAELEIPVALPGQTRRTVAIRPGDFLVGDRDGVVVIPRELVEQVTADAEVVERAEGRIKAGLQSGADREDVYAQNDRFSHITKP